MKTSRIVNITLLCGFVASWLGSFLPWRQEGDFISYMIYGIRILPVFEDNGGILIALLSLSVLMIILQPLKLFVKPFLLSIVFSAALVIVSAFHIIELFIDHKAANGVIGAPTIDVGLILVSLGSILLLFASLIHYLKLNHTIYPDTAKDFRHYS